MHARVLRGLAAKLSCMYYWTLSWQSGQLGIKMSAEKSVFMTFGTSAAARAAWRVTGEVLQLLT